MFSGIIEESATVISIEKAQERTRLTIQSTLDHRETAPGDSIAINGVCLTVVARSDDGILSFELAEETLRRSTLGETKSGDKVNSERSLRLGERLHGHFVFGHVDGTIELISREKEGTSERLEWRVDPAFRKYIAEKGSIAISGVSLTVGKVERDTFSVYIIPHTGDVTILGALPVGSRANLEVDMLARYVANLRAPEDCR